MILYAADPEEWPAWRNALMALDPALELHAWEECRNPAEVDFLIVADRVPGDLSMFHRLKAVQSTWAGVNRLLQDPQLPTHVPIAKMVDAGLSASMSEYIVFHVLDRLRDGQVLRQAQEQGVWRDMKKRRPRDLPVGILGLGTLGQDVACKLVDLGFPVHGWSQSAKKLDSVACFSGRAQLPDFLKRCSILICLLPLTPDTQNIIDAALLLNVPSGAVLINAARGAHLVEADLLAALASGRLAHAILDVFREEPLPPEHPFWTHPQITVSPHVAAITRPGSGAADILENYRRACQGRPLLHQVDRGRGY